MNFLKIMIIFTFTNFFKFAFVNFFSNSFSFSDLRLVYIREVCALFKVLFWEHFQIHELLSDSQTVSNSKLFQIRVREIFRSAIFFQIDKLFSNPQTLWKSSNFMNLFKICELFFKPANIFWFHQKFQNYIPFYSQLAGFLRMSEEKTSNRTMMQSEFVSHCYCLSWVTLWVIAIFRRLRCRRGVSLIATNGRLHAHCNHWAITWARPLLWWPSKRFYCHNRFLFLLLVSCSLGFLFSFTFFYLFFILFLCIIFHFS